MSADTGVPGPTDAELVAGVLAADREAFAAVYDRYGGKLYDFAHSMLRHSEDAQDAVADSFVIVAERLVQLREPDRLRPWLYAIVRSECLRRLKARKRVAFGGDEQLVAMADDAATPDQEAERRALQQIVWDAAAGLADRDRAILDLHLRQGLEGAELGEAMGVTPANAYVMLNRLRGQVDRSLGALLIARLGRDDCDELDGVLGDWDGSFSPLVRKRVARHVDGCDVCSRRRTTIVSPWMLLAGVPIFAAPAALRDRVVTDTELVAHVTPAGEPTGVVPAVATRRRPRTVVAVAAATVLVVVTGGATAALWRGDGDDAPPVLAASSSTPDGPGVTTEPTDGGGTATTKPTPSTATTPPALAAGTLTVSDRAISLGTSGSSASVTLTNTGDRPITYRTTSGAGWLSVSPGSGNVRPGASVPVALRADRGSVGEGQSAATVGVVWATGRADVRVTLVEERDPVVGKPGVGSSPSCNVPVNVGVSDESGLRSVVVRWSGPSGSGSRTMSASGGRWRATIGEFSVGGSVTMRVTATDRRGNTETGPSRTFSVDPCPQ